MNCKFDITTSNTAYEFFTDVLNFNSDELVMEYVVECERDSETFWERNKSKIAFLDLNELTFVAFHVIGSLDDCHEIIETGIQNLQYVLSNDTMLNRFLKNCNIEFDIKHKLNNDETIELAVERWEKEQHWLADWENDTLLPGFYPNCTVSFDINSSRFYKTMNHNNEKLKNVRNINVNRIKVI